MLCASLLGLLPQVLFCFSASRLYRFLYFFAILCCFKTSCLKAKFSLYNADLLCCTFLRPVVDVGVVDDTVLDTTVSSVVGDAACFAINSNDLSCLQFC